MTLKELIDSDPENAKRTDAEVLVWLLSPSGAFEELLVNERGLYARLGPQMAEAILQTLEAVAQADAVVKRALKWLEPSQGGLDMGSPHVRGMVAQMQAANLLTAEQAAALLALPRELSRAESIGIRDLTLGMVEAVR